MDIADIKQIIPSLQRKESPDGGFIVSAEIDGQLASVHTYNSLAIDAAFVNEGEFLLGNLYYENREDAQIELISEILFALEYEF